MSGGPDRSRRSSYALGGSRQRSRRMIFPSTGSLFRFASFTSKEAGGRAKWVLRRAKSFSIRPVESNAPLHAGGGYAAFSSGAEGRSHGPFPAGGVTPPTAL